MPLRQRQEVQALPRTDRLNEVVDVLAGVITDPRGRVLLARRTEGRDLSGLWEFPGGKREPGAPTGRWSPRCFNLTATW